MPMLSIIIPMYNSEKYIERTLLSVVNQPSVVDYEIIVVNDGSTDGSLKIVNEYCRKYPFIHVYSQENQGVSVARNEGMKLAKGKYLMFLDSDDYYVDGFFDETFVNDLNEDYDVIEYSSYVSNMKRNRYAIEKQFKDDVIQLCQWTPIGHFGSCVYKKEMLLKHDIYFDKGIRINEDLVFKFKAFYVARKIRFSSKFCHIYNSTSGSVSKTTGCQFDYVEVWMRALDWLMEIGATNYAIHYVRLKITSRMLLYAKTYTQSGNSKEALIHELKNRNGYEMLLSLNSQQVLPYLKEDLYLFQNDFDKFIFNAKKEGYKVKYGRCLLRIPLIRNIRDRRKYPLLKAK